MPLQQLLEDLPVVRSRVEMVVKKLPSVVQGLKYLSKTDKEEALSIGTFLERNAELYPHFPAILFENQSYSHQSFNAWVNRTANYLASRGIRKGDSVAVLLENRPEVLVLVGALAKLGAISALLNTNQRKDALVHSLKLSNARAYIVGEELVDAFSQVQDELDLDNADLYFLQDRGGVPCPEAFIDLQKQSDGASSANPLTTGRVRLKDPCFYIFT